jgi:hypothetical protein
MSMKLTLRRLQHFMLLHAKALLRLLEHILKVPPIKFIRPLLRGDDLVELESLHWSSFTGFE